MLGNFKKSYLKTFFTGILEHTNTHISDIDIKSYW